MRLILNRILSSIMCLSTLATFPASAQTVPQKMNYQAVARSADGKPLADREVTVRIGIMAAESMERPLYSEEHAVATNRFGLFTLYIGGGDAMEGSMADLNWGGSEHYISVQMDADNSGRFEDMGITQLLTVPYAFYAERSGTSDDDGSRADPNDWTTTGNTGTTAGTNFLGTTDAQDLVFKTNGAEAARFTTSGDLSLISGKAITIGGVNAINSNGVRNIHIGQNAYKEHLPQIAGQFDDRGRCQGHTTEAGLSVCAESESLFLRTDDPLRNPSLQAIFTGMDEHAF